MTDYIKFFCLFMHYNWFFCYTSFRWNLKMIEYWLS